jgi:hypothetical protein
MQALLCLGSWSSLGLIQDEDLEGVVKLDEIEGQIELERVSKVVTVMWAVQPISYCFPSIFRLVL